MAQVFLSYSTEDEADARQLAAIVESRGWSVWWDRQIPPGSSWSDAIEQALVEARCVVVLWSKSSVRSDWVKKEARFAEKRRILVPVLLGQVSPPFEFEHLQAARFDGFDPAPDSDSLAGLYQAVGHIVDAGPERTGVQPSAAPGVRTPSVGPSSGAWPAGLRSAGARLATLAQTWWLIVSSPRAFISSLDLVDRPPVTDALVFALVVRIVLDLIIRPLDSPLGVQGWLVTGIVSWVGIALVSGGILHLSARLFRGRRGLRATLVGYLYVTAAFAPFMEILSLPTVEFSNTHGFDPSGDPFDLLNALTTAPPRVWVSVVAGGAALAAYVVALVSGVGAIHQIGRFRSFVVCSVSLLVEGLVLRWSMLPALGVVYRSFGGPG